MKRVPPNAALFGRHDTQHADCGALVPIASRGADRVAVTPTNEHERYERLAGRARAQRSRHRGKHLRAE